MGGSLSLHAAFGSKSTSGSVSLQTLSAGTTGVSGVLVMSSGAATSGSSGAMLIGTGASNGGRGESLDLTVVAAIVVRAATSACWRALQTRKRAVR